MTRQEKNRRNRLARLIIRKWPVDIVTPKDFWDFNTGKPADNNGGDTLLLFILKEMSETVEFDGSASEAIQKVSGIIEEARDDMAELDCNLAPYWDGGKSGKELWV